MAFSAAPCLLHAQTAPAAATAVPTPAFNATGPAASPAAAPATATTDARRDARAPFKTDSGDTAWMLVSTALVLMMTIPGLALFYGGMVRKKNVIATVAQSFAITAVVTLVWFVCSLFLRLRRPTRAPAPTGSGAA